jgi:mannose-6-phosphate isomerase-like protein (cupin superfamily)
MTTPGLPILTRADEAEVIAGGSITLLAEAMTDGGALAVNRSLLPEGSAGVPPHYHERTTELFFVLDGGMQALAGEKVLTLGPGDLLIAPAGVVHALAPAAGTDADLLVIATPVTERFDYYRLLDRVQAGAAQPQEIVDTRERYDNHFVASAAWDEARAVA